MCKKICATIFVLFVVLAVDAGTINNNAVAKRDVERAMTLLDNAMAVYYNQTTRRIAFRYNPETHSADGEVSVWEYTSALEAVNSVLEGLEAVKGIAPKLYKNNRGRYVTLLADELSKDLNDNVNPRLQSQRQVDKAFCCPRQWYIPHCRRSGLWRRYATGRIG